MCSPFPDRQKPKRPKMDSCLCTCTQLISEIVFTNHFLEFRAASRCFQYRKAERP